MFEIVHYINNKYDIFRDVCKGKDVHVDVFYISPKLNLKNSPPIACNKVAYKTIKLTLKKFIWNFGS